MPELLKEANRAFSEDIPAKNKNPYVATQDRSLAPMEVRAAQFAKNGSTAYTANYNERLPIDVYDDGFNSAYNAGRYGGRLAEIKNPYYHMLSLKQQHAAYEAGVRDLEVVRNQKFVYGDRREVSLLQAMT